MAVALGEEEARKMLMSHQCEHLVDVAAINSPKGVTLAGDLSALEQVQKICSQQGIFNRLLDLDFALDGPRTLNGLILEHLGDIPEVGLGLRIGTVAIEIVQTQDRKIKMVRLHRPGGE